jgi:hypothetical protein
MLKPDIEQLLAKPTVAPSPTIRDILESVEVVARPTLGFEPSPIASIHTAMLAPSIASKETQTT